MGKPVVSANAMRSAIAVSSLFGAAIAAVAKLLETNPNVTWKEILFTVSVSAFAWTIDFQRKNNALPFVGGSAGDSGDQLTTTLPGLGPVDGSGPSSVP